MVLNPAQAMLGAIEFFEKRVILGVTEFRALALLINFADKRQIQYRPYYARIYNIMP